MAIRRRKRARSRRDKLRSSLRLGLVFAGLVAINVYVFFFRGGTSISDVKKAVDRARIEQQEQLAGPHGGPGGSGGLGGLGPTDAGPLFPPPVLPPAPAPHPTPAAPPLHHGHPTHRHEVH